MEKAIKEMSNRKATRDDDIPGDVLKLLGEGGFNILTKLSNIIYNTGEWPQDFTEVTMIALKKTKATKCSDYHTIAHTAKIIAKIPRRRIEKKIEDVLGEDQFGFRRGKGTRDAVGMMRIIAEWTLEIDEELCVCFIDRQKGFDRVNWTKLMQILKRIGIDWRERRLISKLYVEQKVKYNWTEERQEVCILEEEFNKDAVCHQFCSACTVSVLPRKLWMGLETSKTEGKLFKLGNMQMTLC